MEKLIVGRCRIKSGTIIGASLVILKIGFLQVWINDPSLRLAAVGHKPILIVEMCGRFDLLIIQQKAVIK